MRGATAPGLVEALRLLTGAPAPCNMGALSRRGSAPAGGGHVGKPPRPVCGMPEAVKEAEKKHMSGRPSPAPRARTAALLLIALSALLFVHPGATPRAALAASQAYTFHNVVTGGGGGYVPNVIFNTKQANLIYARTDIGGAYRWSAATSSWVPPLDFTSPADWNLMGVDSIATDPVDPNRLVIALGTYTNSFTTQNGAILRSTDQGRTFQRTDLPFKNGGNIPA